MALQAILQALGVGWGDEIILPGYTCSVVPATIGAVGAIPIYADIEQTTFHLDPNSVRQRITRRTRAIILQHTYGLPQDPKPLEKIALEHNLTLIEDAAHALGTTFQGQWAGTLARVSFFSTHWTKTMSTGIGGVAATSDEALARKLRVFYDTSLEPSLTERVRLAMLLMGAALLRHSSFYWWNARLYRVLQKVGLAPQTFSSPEFFSRREPARQVKRFSGIQARMGLKELRFLHQNMAHRKRVVQAYNEFLKRPLKIPKEADPVMLYYPLQVKNKEAILELAREKNIEILDWPKSPVHPLAPGQDGFGYRSGSCPVAEITARRTIALPTHRAIAGKAQQKLLAFLGDIQRKNWLE